MLYLLDTNVGIAVMRHNAQVVARMAAVAPGDCAISTITTYELYTGVEKSADPVQEIAKVKLLLAILITANTGEFSTTTLRPLEGLASVSVAAGFSLRSGVCRSCDALPQAEACGYRRL
ncbi:MAG: hypothetical protein K2R98_14230 [Gemmataceae bacterium]|nr:hypothetical protein [Gemmataceae bacterium]